jgi:hypothetical protein
MQPMDLAFRLLKEDEIEESYPGEREWLARQAAYREQVEGAVRGNRAEMRDETRSVPCPTCGAGIGEPCIGSPYRSHSGRTLALGRKRMGDDIQTGEPMDLAWRLLKEPRLEHDEQIPQEELEEAGPSSPPHYVERLLELQQQIDELRTENEELRTALASAQSGGQPLE